MKKYYKWGEGWDGGGGCQEIFTSKKACYESARKGIKEIKWTDKELRDYTKLYQNIIDIMEVESNGDPIDIIDTIIITERNLSRTY